MVPEIRCAQFELHSPLVVRQSRRVNTDICQLRAFNVLSQQREVDGVRFERMHPSIRTNCPPKDRGVPADVASDVDDAVAWPKQRPEDAGGERFPAPCRSDGGRHMRVPGLVHDEREPLPVWEARNNRIHGLLGLGQSRQPLLAPRVRPPTKCFCNRKYTTTVGMAMTVEAAAMRL